MKNNKKNILILPRWYPNKTDIQLGIFIQRQIVLMQDDFKITVVYAQAISDLTVSGSENKFELVTNKNNGNFTEFIIYFKRNTGFFKKIINFRRYKKAQELGVSKIKEEIDFCHIHVPYRSAMPALRMNKKKNIPFFITEHWSGHLNGLYKRKNAIDTFLYLKTLKKAKKISTVSRALNIAFKKNTGFDSEIIPNYIEQDTSSISLQKEDGFIHILSVGDFDDKTKNISTLVSSFSAALKLNPNLNLTLIGGGPDEKLIKDLIKDLNIPKNNIELTGRKNHAFVLTAMKNCDFYICNSRYETFGMTIAEALFCGKPVISTKCGGPEEFLNEKNSVLIEVDKTYISQQENKELINAIDKMSKTYKNYNSTEISSEIDQLYGEEVMRKKWLGFYGGHL